MDKENDVCSICLETLNLSTATPQPIFELMCEHKLHSECYMNMFRHAKNGGGKQKCPMCRGNDILSENTISYIKSINQPDEEQLELVDTLGTYYGKFDKTEEEETIILWCCVLTNYILYYIQSLYYLLSFIHMLNKNPLFRYWLLYHNDKNDRKHFQRVIT